MRLMIALMLCIFVQQCDIYIAQAEELTPLERVIRRSRPEAHLDIVRRIAFVIERESKRYNLDPNLLAAVIWVESRFKYTARGKIGEIGLMQIRYDIWHKSNILRKKGVDSKRKLQWIGKNVQCGAHILRYFLDRADGDIVLALYRYNSGRTKLPKGVPRHKITYASQVLLKMYEISEHTRRK